MLTHIGPFPTQATFGTSTQHIVTAIFGKDLFLSFFSGNDFFFSGHTGLPFLMALVYWKNKILRVLFLILSVMFGITVLLSHLHYSIDVLAAFYITFCVYKMSRVFFKEDLVSEKYIEKPVVE
jgi:membrane-associated phospholipid phosphatase